MNYEFPKIRHIDDILPAIKDSPEFIIAEKDGYQVVNYVVATQDTFPEVGYISTKMIKGALPQFHSTDTNGHAAIRRECRGLVFGLDGELINRRYHKFFNVNEKDETQLDKIDWNQPHVILEKLDGSMVSPCRVRNHIRWMTKMGVTDTSMEAEAFVAKNPEYARIARATLDMEYTLIFEWCSNKNRIVLDYPEDRLVLTGVRFNDTGRYWSHEEMVEYASHYDGVEVVKSYENFRNHESLVRWVRRQEGIEGIVVRFDDGHMVKIKADWYVRIHKVKSLLGQERDVVKLILNNELDDLLPLLPKEDRERVEKFQTALMERLALCARSLETLVMMYTNTCDRKTFALEHAPKMDGIWKSLVFKFWDKEINEHLTYAAIVDTILTKCGNNASYAVVKEAFLDGVDYV